jgi:hypothetical protein
VERVFADVDADVGDRILESFCHGELLVFGAPHKRRLLLGRSTAGPSHYRTFAGPTISIGWASGRLGLAGRSETLANSLVFREPYLPGAVKIQLQYKHLWTGLIR